MDIFVWIMFILGVRGYFADHPAHIVSGAALMVAASVLAYFDYHHHQNEYYKVDSITETQEVQTIDQ